MEINKFLEFKKKVEQNVEKVIIGKNNIIELVTISFICNGHVLLEDIPGMGKTMMIKAFSRTIGCNYKRIQFTPDLLPSDLTGINYYNQKTNEFEFKSGPLFTNIVLADEINRATPRTQSSLLEAMEERQITIDGLTRKLDEPFMVLATQNPVETYGTFPLPEAQMDRFLMRIGMGYPSREDELQIIKRYKDENPLDKLEAVVTMDEINYVRNNFHEVSIKDDVMNYMMEIIEATRNPSVCSLGVSPRGTLALFRACQVCAALNGRDYIIPEDIITMAPHVLNHRIILKGISKGSNGRDFVNDIIQRIPVPTEKI